MAPAHLLYDPVTDQPVVTIVELLRLDVRLKQLLAAVRDPKQTQAAPGDTPVTRR